MIQKFLKHSLRKLGIDIKRLSISQNQFARLNKILEEKQINLILDVGANSGQFGSELRDFGYKGKIISFEPLLKPYTELINISKKYNDWEAAPRYAIGDLDGNIQINISSNSVSSSILEINKSHIQSEPLSKFENIEEVPIRKLDTVANNFIKNDSRILLKIDTQGYEHKVLEGALNTLKKVSILHMELSLVELYYGQKLFKEMIDYVVKLGFELWAIEPVFVDNLTGRMLQVDAIFSKIE